MAQDFRNGYIETYTAGLEHDFGELKFNASYVGTAGVKLASLDIRQRLHWGRPLRSHPLPSSTPSGQMVGGVGHGRPHDHRGRTPPFTPYRPACLRPPGALAWVSHANYTFSKSLDDTSTALPGFFSAYSSAMLQTPPQDPRNPGADKGPSIFDITHAFTVSLIQELPFDRLSSFRRLGRVASGWQLLNISTLASGSPFTVYSGDAANRRWSQQRGPAGSGRAAGFLHPPQDPRRLFRPRGCQRIVLQYPHWRAGGNRAQPGTIRNPGTRYFPRTGLPQLRFGADQRYGVRPPGRAESRLRCNSAPRSSMFSTWSISACRSMFSAARASALLTVRPAPHAKSSSPSSWSFELNPHAPGSLPRVVAGNCARQDQRIRRAECIRPGASAARPSTRRATGILPVHAGKVRATLALTGNPKCQGGKIP